MLDNTDREIINELKKNSCITMRDLGKKVYLIGQATSTRVIKLEEKGIIKGYTIDVDENKIGNSVHVILNICTENPQHNSYLLFINSQENYILHNYKVSGDCCYILECKFPSNKVLDKFLIELNNYANYKLTIIIDDKIKK
ncbi:Lrp/AsnC family transcriptional regulator [Terrisporobacter sp.]